jgi:hypothetical protein
MKKQEFRSCGSSELQNGAKPWTGGHRDPDFRANPPTLLKSCNSWKLLGTPEPASRFDLQIGESGEIFCIHVGDRPEYEPVMFPMRHIVAILGETFYGGVATGF